MRALRLAVALGIASALLAGPAAGEELRLGFTSSLEYDDNIFNLRSDAPIDEEDDLVFRAGPRIQLRRAQGDLTYTLEYVLRWESFIQETGLDAFDHTAVAQATWRVGPRTQITASERFLYTRSLNRSFFIEDPVDPDLLVEPEVEVGRERIRTNRASVGVTHQFTPRLEGSLSLNHSLFRFSRAGRNDSDSLAGSGSLLYSLTERDRVGGGVGVTWQTFDVPSGADSETFFYRLFGTWSHVFDPTMSIIVRAGPTLIETDPTGGQTSMAVVQRFPFRATGGGGLRLIDSSTCPMVDDGQPVLAGTCELFPDQLTGTRATRVRRSLQIVELVDDRAELGSRLTFFGEMKFTKSWERWRLLLDYRRTDSSSSGVARSTVLDLAQARLFWTPSKNWRLDVSGSWGRRESATDQAVTVVGLRSSPVVFVNADGTLDLVVPGSESVNLRLFETEDDFEVTSWRATFQVRRKLRRNADAFLRVTYLLQERSDIDEDSDLENFRVMLGIRWWFDPIVL